MKKCKYCWEQVQDSAKKCRFCDEWLDNSQKGNSVQHKSNEYKRSNFRPRTLALSLPILSVIWLLVSIIFWIIGLTATWGIDWWTYWATYWDIYWDTLIITIKTFINRLLW